MPRIPDVQSLGQRPIPDSGRPVYRPPTPSFGQGLVEAGASLINTGESMHNTVDKFNYAKAKADYLTKSLEVDTQFQNDTDYKTLPQRYQQAQKAVADQVLGAMPDDRLRAELSVDLQTDMARQNAQIRSRANGLWKDDEIGQAVTQNDQLKRAFIQTGDAKYATAVHDRWNALKAAGVVDANVAAQKIITDANDMTKGRLDVEPASFRMALRNRFAQPIDTKQYATPQKAIQFVVDNLEDDGRGTVTYDSGGATRYGISQVSNPGVDVKNLTKEQAYKIMKEKYWDAANIDQYPPEMRLLVFDAAVNQGIPKATAMAQMSGNDPAKFLQMRRDEYQRLATQDPQQYGKSLKGWNNRLDKLGATQVKYVPAGDIYDNLPPDYLEQVADKAVTEQHQNIIQSIRTDLRYADYAVKTQAKSQYATDPSIINAIEAQEKEMKEDPAGYTAQSPAMSIAYDQMQKNPNDPKARTDYFNKLKDEEMRQGVPEHEVQYAPKAVIDDFKSTISSDNATPDDVIKKINAMKNQFGDLYPHVLGELRNAKIDSKYAIAAELAGSGDVRTFVEAAMMGRDKLLNSLPVKDDAKGIQDAIDSAMQDYTSAINFLPEGPKQSGDYKDAAQLLALRYMAQGTSQKDAVKQAVNVIMPYQVDGTLIVDKGTDLKAVRISADDYKSKLSHMNLVLPPQFDGKETPQSEVYKMTQLRDVKPVVQGDRVYFYWNNKNPVLDKDKVKFYPGTTKPMNLPEAAISFPISDAVAFSKDSISSPQVQQTIISDRAMLTHALNRDVNDLYKPDAKLEGQYYNSPTIKVPMKDGYTKTMAITQDVYDKLSPEQKNIAKKQIEANVKYNQMVLSRIPDNAKQSFRNYIDKSNKISDNYFFYQAQIPPTWSGGMSGAQQKELAMKSGTSAFIRSIGYNYLEVPSWAK